MGNHYNNWRAESGMAETRTVTCGPCNGSGVHGAGTCTVCGGDGKHLFRVLDNEDLIECGACSGSGLHGTSTCSNCGGVGWKKQTHR